MISNTLGIGLQGVQRGMSGIEDAARRIARAGVEGAQGTGGPGASSGSGDILEPLVNLQLYKRSVEASGQVVKTADEMLGTLLDERA